MIDKVSETEALMTLTTIPFRQQQLVADQQVQQQQEMVRAG